MNTIKDKLEKFEEQTLSKYALKSSQTRGRKFANDICPIRTEFQRDRDRIIHSKSFRRLKHKTQVFFAPNKDHYRTRMTHTLEVTQIARIIARALLLNEDLCVLNRNPVHCRFSPKPRPHRHRVRKACKRGYRIGNGKGRACYQCENEGKTSSSPQHSL